MFSRAKEGEIMNEEKRICPLLSADFESGYMNCRLDKCAWYYHDRAMCALEALVEAANEAVVVLEDIPVSLSERADTIAER